MHTLTIRGLSPDNNTLVMSVASSSANNKDRERIREGVGLIFVEVWCCDVTVWFDDEGEQCSPIFAYRNF